MSTSASGLGCWGERGVAAGIHRIFLARFVVRAPLVGRGRVMRRPLELRQAEHQHLGRGFGLEPGLLAALAEHRRMMTVGLPAYPAFAVQHEIELAPRRWQASARRQSKETCLTAAL